MFKLFWVDEEENQKNTIEVEMIDKEEEEQEVWQIALDILEWNDSLYIVAPIAWVEYEDIDLSIQKTILTIKWTREKPKEYYEDWIILRNSECFWWKFIRNIILPENLALNKIKAYMHNNLLIIIIPKLRFDTKTIKINKMEW